MKEYDVIVIGAGPAGLTSALYASRANLSVLILDAGIYGGQMNNTAAIENYPGFDSILGPELSEKMYHSSIQFGAIYEYGLVNKIELQDNSKLVYTDDDVDRAKSVVIATGSKYKKLGIPGEEEFGGQGVSYCAVCDGAFFKNKKVYVIGGGDSAVEEAIYLSNLSSEVNIIHRRNKLRAQKVIQERAFNNKKINFVWNTVVESIIGDETKVTNLKLKNVVSNDENIVNADGVFIYIGEQPITSPFINLGITNSDGWIITDNNMHTSVPGIFAVGDVRDKNLRQIITATNDGGIAGQQVFQYLESLK